LTKKRANFLSQFGWDNVMVVSHLWRASRLRLFRLRAAYGQKTGSKMNTAKRHYAAEKIY